MCKIMALPGIPEHKQEDAKLFVRTARHFLTEIDRDGFGYAMIGDKGISGEKWLKPKHAFTGVKKAERYKAFGETQERCHSIIAHSRLATCGKSIENTHPFVRDNTALIHNGIISNSAALTLKSSTCDSEAILNEYVDKKTFDLPEKIQDVVNALQGWYACAVLSKSETDGWVVDIIKDDTTPLYFGYIEELGCPVICTSESVIERTARLLRLNIKDVFKVPAQSFMRFDAKTGKLIKWLNFTQPKRKAWSKNDWLETNKPKVEPTIGEIKSSTNKDKSFFYFVGDIVALEGVEEREYEILARRKYADGAKENEYKVYFPTIKEEVWIPESKLIFVGEAVPGHKESYPKRWAPN